MTHSGEASQDKKNRSEPINPKICTTFPSLLGSYGDWWSKKQLMAFQEAETEFHYTETVRTEGDRMKH